MLEEKFRIKSGTTEENENGNQVENEEVESPIEKEDNCLNFTDNVGTPLGKDDWLYLVEILRSISEKDDQLHLVEILSDKSGKNDSLGYRIKYLRPVMMRKTRGLEPDMTDGPGIGITDHRNPWNGELALNECSREWWSSGTGWRLSSANMMESGGRNILILINVKWVGLL